MNPAGRADPCRAGARMVTLGTVPEPAFEDDVIAQLKNPLGDFQLHRLHSDPALSVPAIPDDAGHPSIRAQTQGPVLGLELEG